MEPGDLYKTKFSCKFEHVSGKVFRTGSSDILLLLEVNPIYAKVLHPKFRTGLIDRTHIYPIDYPY
jgi:hypothetical protein